MSCVRGPSAGGVRLLSSIFYEDLDAQERHVRAFIGSESLQELNLTSSVRFFLFRPFPENRPRERGKRVRLASDKMKRDDIVARFVPGLRCTRAARRRRIAPCYSVSS